MGKIKTDDKASISGNSCKTENKCRGDASSISSLTKKRRSDDVNSSMNDLNDESVDPQYRPTKERDHHMTRTRESSRSILRKMTKNKVPAEVDRGVFTANVKAEKETVLTGRHGVPSKSKSEVASSSKRLTIGESSRRCSDDEQPTSKRLKPVRIPSVHIQRLRSTEPVLFSLSDSDKRHNAEGKPAKTVFTNTIATDLSENQDKSCQLLDSSHSKTAVKYEPNFPSVHAVDNQKQETFKVKQENDCDDGRSSQMADVACAQRKNEVASGMVVPKSDEELKSPKLSKCCGAADEGLIENKQSNVIARDSATVASVDSNSNDVAVLKVDDGSCSKTARKPRSDDNRKRSGTQDDSGCGITLHIKREPSADAATPEVIAQKSSEADEHALIRGTPNKTARKSSNNLGAKSAKKTRPAKQKQSTHPSSNVSLSILTRSMIKIPG